MFLGSKIRERRMMLGMSEEEFSRLLGISRVTLRKYADGVTSPTAEDLEWIVKVLNMNIADLFDGKDKDGKDIAEVIRERRKSTTALI